MRKGHATPAGLCRTLLEAKLAQTLARNIRLILRFHLEWFDSDSTLSGLTPKNFSSATPTIPPTIRLLCRLCVTPLETSRYCKP
jgi:hypothetical protein